MTELACRTCGAFNDSPLPAACRLCGATFEGFSTGVAASRHEVPMDDFFTTLENTKPFLKVAFEGFAGSGKTFTMAQLAIGLHKRIGSTKPIAYVDTEKAGTHLRHLFKANGIEVLYKPTRTLADLKGTMQRGRDGMFDILMVDSISHIWEDVLRSYMKMKGRTKLEFQDWGVLKPKWKEEFSEPFVNDRYHALMCGRAAFEYSDEKDENNKRQIFKSGVKMKVEGETAYEPDMLIMMERREEMLERDKKIWREATIIKDRSGKIDGKTFQNPTFDAFLPAIEYLLENPVERETPAEEQNSFADESAKREWAKRKDIALETLEATMITAGLAGTSAEAKRHKVEALTLAYGTASWTAIKGMSPDRLEDGLQGIYAYVEQQKAAAPAAA